MPTFVTTPAVTVEEMLAHCWLAEDQRVAFAASPFAPANVSASSHLGAWLTANGYNVANVRTDLYIQDPQTTVCLLNQAFDFLQKALCNTVAHYILCRKGLESWARVTNYYASYFSVHSLLCLQGRTITRLYLDRVLTVHIAAIDLRNHIFGISKRNIGKNPHHEAPWKRYYDIYDRYAVPHGAYELVARKNHIIEPSDESRERNEINYVPFAGFQEIRGLARLRSFSELFKNYLAALEARNTLEEFLIDLRGFASDEDHKYFARVLLRLALAGAILLDIRAANAAIESEWTTMTQRWRNFLTMVFAGSSECYLLKFVPLIGQV